ncbi:hypothetical protein [Saccharothrix algeriensis]|uniref:Ribulose 1,5-bisphosphate carboxylase large subunit n=1 Tax=Saccharothrix algeriensis TaxID=173560 RepID=A0A8T8HV55_9PSEU|nr:hypothetical protein [Saccharothrix algeriensis]MBM7813934.1 hypothetical protein [Saccharothrix algeriensis]QTR02356.1 hypothetical protein J7S33_24865 [Saccharothrix algeriensis]
MDLTPRAFFDLARRTVDTAVSAPGRVLDLLAATERVVRRADDLVTRTGRVLDETEALVARATAVTAAAEAITAEAGRTARTSRELVDDYAPLARRAHPLAQRFVDELSPHEVDAAVQLVDQLPVLTRHLLEDVLPILTTLDRVGPDIHQLLEVTNDVRQAIVGIPGFSFLRKRGEEKEED